jgi:hypothetical protein
MTTKQDHSVLTQLLQELSWEGRNIKAYREGGRGFENVLTAEALQAIDFLPRLQFLGNILRGAHAGDTGRTILADEAEHCEIELLPGNFYLRPGRKSHSEGVAVQPDGIIKSPSVLCVIEAKRIKSNHFSADQLAREYFLVTRDCGNRRPLLLLILSKPPPCSWQAMAAMALLTPFGYALPKCTIKPTSIHRPWSNLSAGIKENFAWITWGEMADIVKEQTKTFENQPGSIEKCVTRLSAAFLDAVRRHG